jgi:diaminopimelate decarboxylase
MRFGLSSTIADDFASDGAVVTISGSLIFELPLNSKTNQPTNQPTMRTISAAVLALSAAWTISSCAAFNAIAFQPKTRMSSSALNMANPGKSAFLDAESAKACVELAGSPVYAYSLEKLEESADACLAFPNEYGLTVRYAMKACPNSSILKYFNSKGINIDASSGFECRRAMSAGIPAENISLSTQELPADFEELVKMGVKVNAW